MRVARDDAMPMVDPDLASTDAIERGGRRVAELEGGVQGDFLLLAVPVEEARVDAQDRTRRRGAHRRAGGSGKVDALVYTGAVVAGRAGQEVGIVGYLGAFDRNDEAVREPSLAASLTLSSLRRLRRRRRRDGPVEDARRRSRGDGRDARGRGDRDRREQDHPRDRE